MSRKIGRNDDCHCGSGIKYKNCCLKKDEITYSMFQNYLGKEVVFNRDIDDKHLGIINNYVMEEIFEGPNNYKKLNLNDGKRILENHYLLFDNSMHEMVQDFHSCAKGCSSCCCLYVDTSLLEAELIRRFINENLNIATQEKILEKNKQNKTHSPTYEQVVREKSLKDKYSLMKIPCAFLINHECSIYPVRPFNCRKHIVFSHPDVCKDPEEKGLLFKSAIVDAGELGVQKLNTVLFKELFYRPNGMFFYKNLSLWFDDSNFDINL
ncbi:SEC-C metal-binding domain-containing protein [Desulfosporosinus fructosivorans]|uniref:SEC-C metal-binding domain-containing protein n=1 Tax=Desulfosporosinus fructosivorans TaxID=2018669 RepID=UPI0018EE5368|nr:SEC-C metal-binding domain-containing protein [Desulfosporosinus fructosivorans]